MHLRDKGLELVRLHRSHITKLRMLRSLSVSNIDPILGLFPASLFLFVNSTLWVAAAALASA